MIILLLHFLFNIIIIIIDFFQLLCFVNIITYDYSKFEIIEFFFINNWSHNLIKKINIDYENNYIDNNWESPINITFPGLMTGCDCLPFNGKIFDEKCEILFLNKNCENINSLEKQYFNILYFPDIINYSNKGIKITIERYKEFNYLNLLNILENNTNYFIDKECICPKYSQICIDCGIIDSFGNHLCITSYNALKNNCFRIELEYDYTLKGTNLIKHFERIFNDNTNYTSYLSFPVEFINVFNNKSCILQDETITSPLISYKLIYNNNEISSNMNKPKNKGCKTYLLGNIKYDYRWINIYSLSMENILNENMKKKLKFLPEFPFDEYIKNNFSIAYRTYIGLGKHCISDVSFIIDIIPYYKKNIKITFILFLFFSLIIFPYYLLSIMVIEQNNLLTYNQNLILNSSYSVIILIYIQFLLNEFYETKKIHENISQIANKYCGDNLTNNLFFSILKDCLKIKNSILYSIYWTIIMLICSLLKFILIITNVYKKRIIFTLNNGNVNPTGNHNYNLITEVEIQMLN